MCRLYLLQPWLHTHTVPLTGDKSYLSEGVIEENVMDVLQAAHRVCPGPRGKGRPDDLVSLFFWFLFQVLTSSAETPCPLRAWCMRVNSPQLNLLWTCMMRTKPEVFNPGLLGVTSFVI